MTVRRAHIDDADLMSWWNIAYESGSLRRNTFFQSPAWNRTWIRHFIQTQHRRELLLLLVEDSDNILALAPFYIQSMALGPIRAWRSIRWIAERLAQYPDLLLVDGDAERVWLAIQQYISENMPDAWLSLSDVLPDSTAACMHGAAWKRMPGEVYYRLDLSVARDGDLTDHVCAHMRREILRSRKRMESNPGLTWEYHEAPSQEILRRLIELNRARFGTASWFHHERNIDFFLELCQAGGKEIWCAVTRRDGEIADIIGGYMHDGSLLYVLSGMNSDHRSISPGTMNLDLTIRYAAAKGLHYFDFLRGDEAYKREFNPERRTSEHLQFMTQKASRRYRIACGVRSAWKRLHGERDHA